MRPTSVSSSPHRRAPLLRRAFGGDQREVAPGVRYPWTATTESQGKGGGKHVSVEGLQRLQCVYGVALAPRATAPAPWGPGFPDEEVGAADRLEVWGTTLDAPADFTEFRLYVGDRLTGIRRVAGY